MKRKNDEKIMGPMFPRVHVNDTDKGGPRAPPRNKMALYEQFSIPSQRQPSSGVSLHKNPIQTTDLFHPASSSRGTGGHEKSCSGYSGFSMSSTQQPQQKQKPRLEDDFEVPVYVQSMKGQDPRKRHTSSDSRSKVRSHNENCPIPLKPIVEREREICRNRFKIGQTNDLNLQNESRVNSNMANSKCTNASDEFISCMDTGYTSAPRIDLSSREQGHMDEISENTMVDSITGLDEVLSPDDVVAMIGHKSFWKARKQLLNQQRLFAVQVFELHRLIKVQKLMASAPHILLEDPDYREKPSKKHTLDFAIQPCTTQKPKPKDDIVKPLEKLEHSSVGKTDPPKSQTQPAPPNNNIQISITTPETTPPPPTVMGGNGLNQWPQYPQPGKQWLLPIMSPSEGLVYKPYPFPSFVGPVAHNHHPHPLGYFPHYGIPAMNETVIGPTQLNLFHPPSGAHRSASRGSELVQVSTASSPDVQASEGRNGNTLHLFPTTTASNNNPNPNPTAPRVIKVVPRNARTASESVARIFQSIQEGRK